MRVITSSRTRISPQRFQRGLLDIGDRAHRIGQDKPVFVYKLVAQGTVEERMLELQQRKKALAAGIYEASGNAAAALEAADIERLFEPLGERRRGRGE